MGTSSSGSDTPMKTSPGASGPVPMRLFEHEWELPWPREPRDLLGHFARIVGERLGAGEYPVRFVVCSTDAERQSCHCEVGILSVGDAAPGGGGPGPAEPRSMAI